MPTAPGKLFVKYTTNLIQHTASVNYIDGVDIEDTVATRIDGVLLGSTIQACVTPSVVLSGWGIKSMAGVELYFEPFSSLLPGTATPPINSTQWYSNTLRLLGKAVGPTVGAPRGRTSFELFVSDGVRMFPGQKYLDVASSSQWNGLWDLFDTNLRFFADTLGQKADPSALAAVQWHAHVQKTHGC